jgi:hypothetical protein
MFKHQSVLFFILFLKVKSEVSHSKIHENRTVFSFFLDKLEITFKSS